MSGRPAAQERYHPHLRGNREPTGVGDPYLFETEDSIGKQQTQDIRGQGAGGEQSRPRSDHRVDAHQDDESEERRRNHGDQEERANRVQVSVTGEPQMQVNSTDNGEERGCAHS